MSVALFTKSKSFKCSNLFLLLKNQKSLTIQQTECVICVVGFLLWKYRTKLTRERSKANSRLETKIQSIQYFWTFKSLTWSRSTRKWKKALKQQAGATPLKRDILKEILLKFSWSSQRSKSKSSDRLLLAYVKLYEKVIVWSGLLIILRFELSNSFLLSKDTITETFFGKSLFPTESNSNAFLRMHDSRFMSGEAITLNWFVVFLNAEGGGFLLNAGKKQT